MTAPGTWQPDAAGTSLVIAADARPATNDAARGTPVARLLNTHGALQRDNELRSLAAAWLASLKSEHTRDAYARDLAEWLNWLHAQGVDPRRPTRGHGDVYRTHLEQLRFERKGKQAGLGPASVRRKMSAVSSFYTYLEDVDEDGAFRNRVRRAEKPKRAKTGKTGALTEPQVRQLLAAADAWVGEVAGTPGRLVYALRARALVYMLAGFGIRASEALTVRLEDFDEHAGVPRVRFTVKGGDDLFRRVPDGVDRAIADYVAATGNRTTGPVLVTATGRPLVRSETWRILRQVATRAGLTLSPHVLRATFITVALKHKDVEIVRVAVGHASRAQTESYNRRTQELNDDPSVLVTELFT